MTDVSHLKRLSAIKSNGGVKFLTPAAFPGSHCPLHTALALVGSIKGLSSLVVGTQECATYSSIVLKNTQATSAELHWTYILDANEVVFGCRQGVMDALQKMDQAGVNAILLLTTCVPELIGEDIEGIIREIQPKLSARLLCVLLGHFKCNSFPAGSWKTLQALGSLMEPSETQPQAINVLGILPIKKHTPMPSILSTLQSQGFSLRCLSQGASSLEDFLAAPDATLNLVLSPFADPLATAMEQSFGIPTFRLHNAYDVAEIDELNSSIAKMLKIQWRYELCHERTEALSLQEQAKERLAGCRYIGTHIGRARMLPLASYLATLGMEPLLLHLEEFWPDDTYWAEKLNALSYDPLVCHMVNSSSDVPLLESFSPDLCLGGLTGMNIRIPCISDLSSLYSLFGYQRTSILLKKLLHALDQRTVIKEGCARHGFA